VTTIDPVSSPAWRPRIASLAALIPEPTTITAIVESAASHYGWSESFTINVLAAGERTAFGQRGEKWWRFAETEIRIGTDEHGEATVMTFSERSCRFCCESFTPRRAKQAFCDSTCKAGHHRRVGRAAA
jgi:hypothetical protein